MVGQPQTAQTSSALPSPQPQGPDPNGVGGEASTNDRIALMSMAVSPEQRMSLEVISEHSAFTKTQRSLNRCCWYLQANQHHAPFRGQVYTSVDASQ